MGIPNSMNLIFVLSARINRTDHFLLTYDKVEKKYDLRKSFKAADYKCYSGMEMIELGNEINFDVILNLISD